MTPSGIEPATLRLVAQYLNQLRYRVAQGYIIYKKISISRRLRKVHQDSLAFDIIAFINP